MSNIVAEIRQATERAIAATARLHDDYVYTGRLWQELLQRGRYGLSPLRVLNAKTGTLLAGAKEWTEAARLSQMRIRVRTFKDLASQAELFIAALLKLWLTQFPEIVDEKSITLAAILQSNDLADLKSQAIALAVDAAVLDRMKGRPAKWFSYLKQHLGSTLGDHQIGQYIERKAARDVLEHHDGVVDSSYREKAGSASKYKVGDLVEPNDDEIDSLYDLVRNLIQRIGEDGQRKAWSLSPGTRI